LHQFNGFASGVQATTIFRKNNFFRRVNEVNLPDNPLVPEISGFLFPEKCYFWMPGLPAKLR
jgi:hypothetical protein